MLLFSIVMWLFILYRMSVESKIVLIKMNWWPSCQGRDHRPLTSIIIILSKLSGKLINLPAFMVKSTSISSLISTFFYFMMWFFVGYLPVATFSLLNVKSTAFYLHVRKCNPVEVKPRGCKFFIKLWKIRCSVSIALN